MIINSLLDTDQYIFTMCQAILRKYPNVWAKFKFKCRNKKLEFSIKQREQLLAEIKHLCSLRFTKPELDYLKSFRYYEPFFIEFLRLFQLNEDYIRIYSYHDELCIDIEGPLFSVIWFEVPILRIISTINHMEDGEYKWIAGKKRLANKVSYVKSNLHRDQIKDFRLADFGTRRANSPRWHEEVIKFLMEYAKDFFIGTSNVYFAKKYGLTPIGTMAHLWVQMHQQVGVRLYDSQKESFKAWSDVYQGDLGIALSDTVGFDAFLKDFNLKMSKLFDGARHDSGDPYNWCKRLIEHYNNFRIDPKSKTAVFSDGLNFKLAVDLFKTFNGLINTSFGIGTNLTNDLGGVEPLQIVIKMVECNYRPVAKISDSKGKGMCEDPAYLSYLKKVFSIKD